MVDLRLTAAAANNASADGNGNANVGPSLANKIANEIFSVPHSRMKELVTEYLEKVPKIEDFTVDCDLVENILQSVYQAMWELKSHEYIEDHYIMDTLKARLQAKQVYNRLVCNCHEDSKLIDVIKLVEEVYSAPDFTARQKIGVKLQTAIRSFLREFLQHMDQEEATFQPLLHKYFNVNELQSLHKTVLDQHRLWKAKVGAEKSLKLIKRKREAEDVDFDFCFDGLRFRKSYCQEVNEYFSGKAPKSSDVEDDEGEDKAGSSSGKKKKEEEEKTTVTAAAVCNDMPNEIMLHIFAYLSPLDLIRGCANVSRRWNRIALTPNLWKNLYPVQWARGNWSFHFDDPLESIDLLEECRIKDEDDEISDDSESDNGDNGDDDDDNDNDGCSNSGDGNNNEKSNYISKEKKILVGISKHLLPRIGAGVVKLILAGSLALDDDLALGLLRKVPNLRHLDLSYSHRITDGAFKGLSRYAALRQLRHLDLSGCRRLTDMTCERISACFFALRRKKKQLSQLNHISLSGCFRITCEGLETLQVHAEALEWLDLSGCFRLTGSHLKTFISQCSKLKPEGLFYCNMITDGPHPQSANGCQNLDCPVRDCCQKTGIRN